MYKIYKRMIACYSDKTFNFAVSARNIKSTY